MSMTLKEIRAMVNINLTEHTIQVSIYLFLLHSNQLDNNKRSLFCFALETVMQEVRCGELPPYVPTMRMYGRLDT